MVPKIYRDLSALDLHIVQYVFLMFTNFLSDIKVSENTTGFIEFCQTPMSEQRKLENI